MEKTRQAAILTLSISRDPIRVNAQLERNLNQFGERVLDLEIILRNWNTRDSLWTVPSWFREGDVLFLYCSKSALGNLKKATHIDNSLRGLSDRIEAAVETTAGRIFAFSTIAGEPGRRRDISQGEGPRPGVAAKIKQAVLLKDAVDLAELINVLEVRRRGALTIPNRDQLAALTKRCDQDLTHTFGHIPKLVELDINGELVQSGEDSVIQHCCCEEHFRFHFVRPAIGKIFPDADIFEEVKLWEREAFLGTCDFLVVGNSYVTPVEAKFLTPRGIDHSQAQKYLRLDAYKRRGSLERVQLAEDLHPKSSLLVSPEGFGRSTSEEPYQWLCAPSELPSKKAFI